MDQPYSEIDDLAKTGRWQQLYSKYPLCWKCLRGLLLLVCIAGVIAGIVVYMFFRQEVTCVKPKKHQVLVPGKNLTVPAAGALLVQTACGTGDRMSRQPDMSFVEDFHFDGPSIVVSLSDTDQQVIGFGGALTQASASLFKGLRPELQQRFLDLYYGEKGIGYTVGRIPINSCDFSPVDYTFDDVDGDFHLKHFDSNVTHDLSYQIPFLKNVTEAARASGSALRLLASPWSPPAWMKTNHVRTGIKWDTLGGNIQFGVGSLREECRSTWANYMSKWLDAYKAHAIDVWAITVQNEPSNAPSWEGCKWSPGAASHFLGHFLGPLLQKKHPDVKIFACDDQTKTKLPEWALATYSHSSAGKYADGLAFHWYGDSDFHNIASVHEKFPHAILLPTEATYEWAYWNPLTVMSDGIWRYGEGYAQDIIGDLNAGAAGWFDWNVLLDEHGGPNHAGNNCDAPIVTTKKGGQQLWIHPQYYYIGHISKYILPKSTRLGVKIAGGPSFSRSLGDWMRATFYAYGYCAEQSGLQATSFRRPDGIVVAVVLNCAAADVEFKLQVSAGARPALKAAIPAHAIQTYLLKPEVPSEAILEAAAVSRDE